MQAPQKLLIATGIVALTLGSTWYLCHRSGLTESLTDRKSENASSLAAPTSGQSNSPARLALHQNAAESFEVIAERSLKGLPTKADLQKLTAEEAHHTPALLMQAASELGDVAEALHAKLKQAEGDSDATEKALQDGISFYRRCLDQNESPESVRALCYSHYRELREKAGKPENQDEANAIPLNVRSLANFLADR